MTTSSAQFDVIIDVITKNLVQAKKELAGLTQEVNKSGKAHRDAGNAAAEHDYKLNQGVTGSSSAAKSFSKLSQTIGSGPNGLVGAYATLAANAFAVSAAFNQLRSAEQVQQLLQGLEAQGNRTGRTLSLVSDNIVKITQGSLSAADAMRAAAQGSAASLNAEDMDALTKVATNASKVLGRNIPDSMDRIIKGVTKLEPELLDELGLMTKLTDASEQYARANNKSASSLSSLEKRKAFIEAIKKEGDLKFGGIDAQVDANKFDQLAATFENLKNTTFGFIAASTTMNTILNLLINTSTGLTGALTLFGSMVAKPLIGWLHGISTSALNTAKDLKQLAIEQTAAAKEAVTKSSATVNTARVNATNASDLSDKAPKKYSDVLGSLTSGRAAAEDYDVAIKSLTRSNSTYEASIRRLFASNAANTAETIAKIEAAKAEIVANEQRIISIRELQLAEEAAAKTRLANLAGVQQARVTARAEVKAEAAAAALASAGNLKLGSSFTNIVKSVGAYSRELAIGRQAAIAQALANGVAAPTFGILASGMNAAKIAGYGFSLSIKTIGITIATMLPWIGILQIVLAIAQELYEKFFVTDADKKKKEALKDLNTVLESTKGKIEELNRVSLTQSQLGNRSIQLLIIQANAVMELSSAYLAMSKASALAMANEDKYKEAREATKTTLPFTDDNLILQESLRKQKNLSSQSGVDFDSKAVKAFANTANSGIFGGFTEETKTAIKALDELGTLSPKAAEGFYKLIKPTDSEAQKLKILQHVMQQAKEGFGSLGEAVENFKTSLQNTEQAQTDFLRSLKPTTAFDNVTENFENLNRSIYELKKQMGSGDTANKAFVSGFKDLMTALGPNTRKILDIDTQGSLTVLDQIDTRIQTLSSKRAELVASGEKQNKTAIDKIDKELNGEGKILGLKAEKLSLEQQLVGPLEKGVASYTKQLADAQVLTIVSQSLVTLAQARLSALQRQGIVVGDDIKKQMLAQNNIIKLQMQEQSIKLKFLELDLKKNELLIQNIDAQLSLLEVYDKQAEAQKKIELSTKLAALASTNQINTKEYRDTLSQKTYLETPEAARASAEDLQHTRDGIVQSNRVLQSQVSATRNNLQAMATGMNSAMEIQVAYEKQNLKVLKEKYDLLTAIKSVTRETSVAQEKVLDILTGSTDTLRNELSTIIILSKAKRDSIEKELQFKLQDLELSKKLAASNGNQEQVKYYESIIALTLRKANADSENLRVSTDLEVLNKIAIKDLEDLINRKQALLSYEQKIADAIGEQLSSNLELVTSQIDLSAKKRGVTDTNATSIIKEVKAAEAAYQLALLQADIKKKTLDLEFALLSAKKEQSLRELQVARIAIEGMQARTAKSLGSGTLNTKDTANATVEMAGYTNQLAMLDDIIKSTEGITTESLRASFDALKKALDDGVEVAANKLRLAMTTGPRVKDGFLSDNANMAERETARKTQGDTNTTLGITTGVIDEISSYTDKLRESLSALGPQGELVLSVMDSATMIGNSFVDAFQTISEYGASSTQGIAAGLQAVSSVISSVSSILAASSKAKIANIDKEIAAEQKRDGKSAESVAKIAAMEKKKDDAARKSFNVQKKLMMAQAVISTAAAIVMALGQLGPIAGPIVAGVMAAMGMAQIAIISGTNYESSLSSTQPTTPSTLTIGNRSNTSIDLAKGPNANAGGEAAYLRSSSGYGSDASNYRTIGSAYGGDPFRGYGNRGFIVGEKGPEVISPDTPISVTPSSNMQSGNPIDATINIQALDSSGVQEVLISQKGNIIKMLRDAANASGQKFMENVNVNVYTRPNIGKL